jgi:molybdate transport system regulatory protein
VFSVPPFFGAPGPMPDTRLSIRLDLPSGDRIGPGKIALLEAIQASGSISGAARALGMSYRRAWLLVEEINESLQQPAVTAATGGRQGGGAALTPSGERVIALYRSIEDIARSSAKEEFRAVGKLVRKGRAARA